MANQFLIKNTIADMRNLSASEIASLQGSNPTYAGVELLGYYEIGDIVTPKYYYLTNIAQADNGGNIISVGGGVKLYYAIDSELNVKCFGAKGDGVADDTISIQNCINTMVNTIYFPTPTVGYKVTTLRIKERQTLKGDCKYSQAIGNVNRGIIGDGINTTIVIGNGVTSNEQFISPRISYVELQDLIITNIGAGCIDINGCINWRIFNCRIRSTGDEVRTIDANFSWRGIISDCYIDASGNNSWAISCLNQMNGVQIHRNVVTGGLKGGAIVFGRGQGVSIKWNTIEYCQKGVFVASTADSARDGGVNGLEVNNNYIERVGAPICLAKNFGVNGASVSNNYLVNNGDDVTPSDGIKYGIITWGRMRNTTIENNTLWSNNMSMYVWHLPVEDPLMCVDNRIENNYENMTDQASLFSLAGAYSNNSGYLRTMGGRNYFSFFKKYETKGLQSSNELREWISPLYTANETIILHQWVDMDILKFGGNIFHIQIIDKIGDVTGCGLRIGNNNNANAVIANLDIGTLVYRRGIATVKDSISSASIFPDILNTIGITGSTLPTSTGTFRVKILYRAS
nr:right-handed parallel beta-helix repeat-containing protein [uncultured Sphingobacterium sp.]